MRHIFQLHALTPSLPICREANTKSERKEQNRRYLELAFLHEFHFQSVEVGIVPLYQYCAQEQEWCNVISG